MPRAYRIKRSGKSPRWTYSMPRGELPRAAMEVEPFFGSRTLVVNRINVAFDQRRMGYGTRLYEAAANDACDEGLRLTSSVERSMFSEAFWRKQRKAGRAVCLKRNTDRRDNYSRYPLLDLNEALAQKYRDRMYGTPDYDRANRELERIKKKLPKPRYNAEHEGYWPCLRWALKKKLCKQRPISLSGLFTPRRS